MSRYIDVEPSKIDEVIKTELGMYDTVELKEMLSYYPTADVAPVIHAHWELWDHEEASTTLRCSRCGREVEHKGSYDEIKDVFPYCHCGAKMDEESII